MPTTRPDVRDFHTLAALIEARGAQVRGRAFRCPWHDDKSASGSIHEAADGRWRFRCHGCERTGDAIDLAAEAEGVDAAEYLRRHPDPDRAPAARPAPRNASGSAPRASWPTIDALAQAKARQAGGEVQAVYNYEIPGQSIPALAVVRIGQAGGKTFRQAHHDGTGWTDTAPPKPWPLYRLPDLASASSVVVCEGEKAADALRAVGITATTSPCGSGKGEHADWRPLAGKRVVVWPDHDTKGIEHADQVVRLLQALPTPPARIAHIDPAALNLPPKGDAVEYLAAVDGDANAKRDAVLVVLRAAPLVAGPARPSDALAALIEDEIAGRSALVPWPWPMLTRQSRALLPGKVTLLCGSPGGAKTWLVIQSLLYWIGAGICARALFLEETAPWYLKRALAHIEGNPDHLAQEWTRANPDDAREAAARHANVLDAFGRSFTCRGNLTLNAVVSWIEQQATAGARVLVVDPVSLADPGNLKPWEADRAFMARVKVAIESAGASLVLVTHPRKASSGPRPSTPSLDDLAGGASYNRASASVLWVNGYPDTKRCRVRHADGSDIAADLHKSVAILKARDAAGAHGAIGFQFVRLRFTEAGLIVKESGP